MPEVSRFFGIVEIKPLDNYKLWIKFSDNKNAVINVLPYINDGISVKLLDKEFFKQAKIDEFGGVTWANGFDFCPNFLKQIAE